jgi:tetratricopeptide (TPR) repeat protein
MRFFLIGLLFFNACLSISSRAADRSEDQIFRQSLSFYRQKNYRASQALLLRLCADRPERAVYWFNLGNSSYMKGDYRLADRSFVKVVKLNSPLAPAAILYLAKTRRASGHIGSAKRLLIQLARSAKAPQAIRQAAKDDLVEIRSLSIADLDSKALRLYRGGEFEAALKLIQQEARPTADLLLLKSLILVKLQREDLASDVLKSLKTTARHGPLESLANSLLARVRENAARPYWLNLDLNAGYDSNVRRALEAEGGSPVSAALSGGGRLFSRNLWELRAGYFGWWNEFPRHADLRVYDNELNTTAIRESGANRVAMSAFIRHEVWESTTTKLETGARFDARASFGRSDAGVTAAVSRTNALSRDYSYLGGESSGVRVHYGLIHSPVYGQVFLLAERQAFGTQTYSTGEDVPTGYVGWGPGLRVLWRYRKAWTVDFFALYEYRRYSDLAQPGDLSRTDRLISSELQVRRILTEELSVYLLVAAIVNHSTLSSSGLDQNYKDFQSLLGLQWQAF